MRFQLTLAFTVTAAIPPHGLELNPEPTPYTSHLVPPPPLRYSYYSLRLVNSMSI